MLRRLFLSPLSSCSSPTTRAVLQPRRLSTALSVQWMSSEQSLLPRRITTSTNSGVGISTTTRRQWQPYPLPEDHYYQHHDRKEHHHHQQKQQRCFCAAAAEPPSSTTTTTTVTTTFDKEDDSAAPKLPEETAAATSTTTVMKDHGDDDEDEEDDDDEDDTNETEDSKDDDEDDDDDDDEDDDDDDDDEDELDDADEDEDDEVEDEVQDVADDKNNNNNNNNDDDAADDFDAGEHLADFSGHMSKPHWNRHETRLVASQVSTVDPEEDGHTNGGDGHEHDGTTPAGEQQQQQVRRRNPDGQVFYELSHPKRRVTIQPYKNRACVDFRQYFSLNNHWVPTRKGISMSAKSFRILVDILQQPDQKVEKEIQALHEKWLQSKYNTTKPNKTKKPDDQYL